jgi:hypothetical protein
MPADGDDTYRSPEKFSIAAKPGTRTLTDKRNYTITYSVDIRVNEADAPNTLYLWLPLPSNSASQKRNRLLSQSAEPFVANYRGSSLYRLNDLAPGETRRIDFSWLVEVYTLESKVTQNQVKEPVSERRWLQPTALVQSDNEEALAESKTIAGRDTNRYVVARKIYQTARDALAAASLRYVDSQNAVYDAVIHTCALMRAAGIPARPISGILVDQARAARTHFWVEFWIENMGWLPADPALGAGITPDNWMPRENAADFYFGSCDNQRIAFSHGGATLAPMNPKSRLVSRDRSFALQNIWEEAAGGLTSYSSFWSDVQVTGVYVN